MWEEEILSSVLSCNLSEIKKFTRKENVNHEIEETNGLTILHVTAGVLSPDSSQVASHLLQLGGNPNLRSYDGLTPVHIAAMWNNCDVLEKLLCYGGSPWLQDCDGKSAFDLAVENDAIDCYNTLTIFDCKLKTTCKTSDLTESSESIISFVRDSNCSLKLWNGIATTSLACNVNDILCNRGSSHSDESTVISESVSCNSTFERIRQWLKETSTYLKQQDTIKTSSDYFSEISKFQAKCASLSSIINKSGNSQAGCISHLGAQYISETCALKRNCIYYSHEGSHSSSVSNPIEKLENSWGTMNGENLDETLIPTMSSSEHEIEVNHQDESEGIVLIEKCGSSLQSGLSQDESCASSMSTKSSWKSYRTARERLSACSSSILEDLRKLNNTQVFSELMKYGEHPGPITDTTRKLYLHRLAGLKQGLVSTHLVSPQKYSAELTLYLEGKLDLGRAEHLEQEMTADFDRESIMSDWREGHQRCSFNYFLLDPRVTKNLPLRSQSLSFSDTAHIFLNSLFYVGKGTRARPYDHLYEAAKAMNSDVKTQQLSAKVQHILDIWESGLGVVCLHCFQNSIPAEAYTREACIIDAIGLSNLTNIKKGNVYGIASKWTGSKKRQVGVLMLSRALKIFCLEGERYIRPKDMKKTDTVDAL